ncbi:hypothetical protein [uncultured Aliiroseovarius sp.]|uniref:hypothetical protein n=1 Tax=uncultured Aliiroseovarius sp. TaxID=1658783 RepID=UPI002598A8B8|nr:hypothetical protein [uncultured Aliiroseovarius sp.]
MAIMKSKAMRIELTTSHLCDEPGTKLAMFCDPSDCDDLASIFERRVGKVLDIYAVDDKGNPYAVSIQFVDRVGDEAFLIEDKVVVLRFAKKSARNASERMRKIANSLGKAWNCIDLEHDEKEEFSFLVLRG